MVTCEKSSTKSQIHASLKPNFALTERKNSRTLLQIYAKMYYNFI